VQGVEWGFRENRSRRTSDSFTLESRVLHLEAGQYRLKLSLEGELYWRSFYLEPRTAQRRQLATARAQEIGVQLGGGSLLPLEVQAAAFDIDTGQELTASTEFSVFVDGRWLPWSPPVSSSLTSGESYRFRFEREGYFPQTYSLVIQPYQTVLRLEARLIPSPGTLRLQSNEGGLALSLNGSDQYFAGGKERAYRKLQPLQAGTQELLLNPGHYLVSVQLDPSLSRSLTVQVDPEQTVTLSVELDRQQRNLAISPVD
jgi:serine/threonine-protein kinase